jgi:hypothetical protein
MTDFCEEDLTGAHFERVNLRSATFTKVVVNAELNRRMPERARMRPDDSDGFREAWAILERLWEGTVARARTFPETALHRSIDDEWSFIQTLRHLNFACAAWVERIILGAPRRGTRGTFRGTKLISSSCGP